MKANEFDKKFDENKDISKHLDISKARRPKKEQVTLKKGRVITNKRTLKS